MKLDEVEAVCDQVQSLAKELSACGTKECAERLIAACGARLRMRSRFGNVAEQLERVAEAAKVFTKAHVNLTTARADLSRAAARMPCALDIHRSEQSKSSV